tara:strand:+ start:510 stop:686 length:177 start_codon:yes stop_codon:yes gene_type:complete
MIESLLLVISFFSIGIFDKLPLQFIGTEWLIVGIGFILALGILIGVGIVMLKRRVRKN